MTWLYGPLQASSDKLSLLPTSLDRIGTSKLNSSINKKSILKKRSVLETMLQLSLSASSPPYPAAAAVQAQRSNVISSPHKSDTASIAGVVLGYIASLYSLRLLRRDDSYEFPSVSSSGEQSLANERKHIHFNDKVEQWIAVDIVDDGDDEDGIESNAIDIDDDHDSSLDDDFLMMKGSARPKSLSRSNRSPLRLVVVLKLAP